MFYSSVLISVIILIVIPVHSGRFSTWRLVFNDEFSQDSLNNDKWEIQTGCTEVYGAGNLQCYMPGTNNIKIQDGILTITALVEATETKNFTSGRFVQIGNGLKHGLFLVRARLPKGNHLWPALWLLKRENCYQEIDIMEAKGDYPLRMVWTAHYGFNFTNLVRHGTANNTGIDFSQEFHNFGILWTARKLSWLIDGTEYYSVSLDRRTWSAPGKQPCVQGPFTQKMNFIFNMAVGGTFFGQTPFTPEDAKQWTKPTLEIDWVRVYQYQDFGEPEAYQDYN